MLALILCIAAILVMFYGLYAVIKLRSRIPGGRVKRTWNFLLGLVILFTLGYLVTPAFSLLPAEVKDTVVGVVFFFGAVFVVIVVKLYDKLVNDIGL